MTGTFILALVIGGFAVYGLASCIENLLDRYHDQHWWQTRERKQMRIRDDG